MGRNILVDNVQYEGESLTVEEERIFDAHFKTLIANTSTWVELLYPDVREVQTAPAGGSLSETAMAARGELDRMPVQEKHIIRPAGYLSSLLWARREHVNLSVQIAKKNLNGVFKGSDGRGTELVWQQTKAWHILRTQDTTETPAKAWDRWKGSSGPGPTAWLSGADNWIGFGATNSTAVNIDKRTMLCILGYAELGTNMPVQDVKLQVDNVTFQPFTIQGFVGLAPNDGRVPISPVKTQVLSPRAQVLGTVYTDAAVLSKLMVIGITIGQASYMVNEYLATVTL